MKIKAKDLRKTILLGGMSVDEAAEWCEKSLKMYGVMDEEWFRILILHLVNLEDRGDMEFVYYPDDAQDDKGVKDYLLELPDCKGLPTACYYYSGDIANTEETARDDCEVLNKFLEDFYG
jgi:hypothetical protein